MAWLKFICIAVSVFCILMWLNNVLVELCNTITSNRLAFTSKDNTDKEKNEAIISAWFRILMVCISAIALGGAILL